MTRSKLSRVAPAIAVAVVGFAAAGIAGETTGITDTTIKIGVITPITGVQAHYGASHKTVTELVAKEANAAGGINGRKIELIIEDEGCSGTKARAAINKLVIRDEVFAVFGGTCAAAIVPVVPIMIENNVPYLTAMVISDSLTDPLSKYVFRAQVPATRIGRLMTTYAVEALNAKRVAIVNQDDEYGAGELKGSMLELERRKVTPVAHETHKLGDSDFGAQALRLKQANPDVVLIHSYAPQTAGLIRKAYELGLRARYIAGVASGNTQILQLIGEEPSRGNFNAISVNVDPTGKINPLTIDFVARYTKEYPEISKRPGIPGPGEFQVIGGLTPFLEGLRRAGRNLARDSFIAALESITELKTAGYPTVTFSKDNHDGVLKAPFWYYDKDGKILVTEKVYSTD
jgi:branched-chain amino acid transport system substrate-binding protein